MYYDNSSLTISNFQNLYFSLQKESGNNKIIAVYKREMDSFFSAVFEEENLTLISIFYALPESVKVVIPETLNDSSLNEICTSSDLQLNIKYQDNTSAILSRINGNFCNDAEKYEFLRN